jgi:chloride channel protein, CIC family
MFERLKNTFHYVRIKYIDYKAYIIITSIIIGMISALAAVALKNAVHFIKWLLQFDFNSQNFNFLYVLYPVVGIALTLLYIKVFLKGSFSKGLSNLIYSLSKRNTDIPQHQMYSHMITSAATVGFGGSVGLEAPIVSTGAAIGANTAKRLRLNPLDRNLLIACGSAAGISAVFNSPIAGIIFAFEVLLPEISIPSFIPLLISSASASVFSNLLYSDRLFYLVTQGWQFKAIPFYILLGIVTGLVSSYMVKVTFQMDRYFKNSSAGFIKKLLIGGGLLGLLILIFPPLYGEGYGVIKDLLNGNTAVLISSAIYKNFVFNEWFVVFVGIAIIFVKVFATSLTVGAGGNGGIFAPSLFTGALVGLVFVQIMRLTGIIELNQANFIAASMAGILSGVIHAPLTAIFLIAEVTGGYALFVPLMIVSAMSYFLSRYFEPYSVYTKILVKEKGWIKENKDKILMDQITLMDLVETDFTVICDNEQLSQVIDKAYHSNRTLFPIISTDSKFVGIVYLNDIKDYVFKVKKPGNQSIMKFAKPSPGIIDSSDAVSIVMQKFELNNAWHIPVTEGGKYIGFVSKSRLLNTYRKLIQQERQIF